MSSPHQIINEFSITKIYSLTSQSMIIIIKVKSTLILRSAIVVGVVPLKIPGLFSLIDLFQEPFKISFLIDMNTIKGVDTYSCIFFLDLDISNCLINDFNPHMKESIKLHKQKFDLLFKNISLKGLEVSKISKNDLLSFMDGHWSKKIKRFSYQPATSKETDLLKNVIFSNNKIKHIDVKRESIIPLPTIVLGKSLSNKDIGVDSHVLFLTGNQNYRREIVKLILDHVTQDDNSNIIIFDFGLNIDLNKLFHRNYLFSDIILDPFTFSDANQSNIFISQLSLIAKTILRLRDREIVLLEEKLSSYFNESTNFSLSGFYNFISDQFSDSLLDSSLQTNSFAQDVSNADTDYTSLIKNTQSPIKSSDLESLITKMKYLTNLLNPDRKESFTSILSKNHLDVFSINTTPDQKALFFYLFNLYYTLNPHRFKNFKFFFLHFNSMLFDNFIEFDTSWVHPDLLHSLFDSSDIFSVKKIFNQLDTRIYTSSIANAPYNLLSQSVKENIERLQYLHNYSLIESPKLQRQEFFKISIPTTEKIIPLPSFNEFKHLILLLFNSEVEFSFKKLFAIYFISKKSCNQLVRDNYLRKNKTTYMITEKSTSLKKYIIDYLSFQASLTIEENDFIIKISDPIAYNPLFNESFSFTENIELILTRLLANQLISGRLNPFLLYYFLEFKQQHIDSIQLAKYLVIGIQIQNHSPITTQTNVFDSTQTVSQPEAESLQDYLSEIKNVISEIPTGTHISHTGNITPKIELASKALNPPINSPTKYPQDVNTLVDQINSRVSAELTDSKLAFPYRPIFLAMKFLKTDTVDLLMEDLNHLNDLTSNLCIVEVSST